VSKDKRNVNANNVNGAMQPPLPEEKKRPVTPHHPQPQPTASSSSTWNDSQWAAVKQTYLGKSAAEPDQAQLEQRRKQRSKKKITFKFQWEDAEDTSHLDDDDPLYAGIKVAPKAKRQRLDELPKSTTPTIESARSKPIDKMTTRDWHIFRETHNIVVRGGKAPPPMRSFREPPAPFIAPLHPAILEAVEITLKYKEPSPIQRQAIPIGLQRRDLIGVAETGSGKTAAFGIPLCHYLLNLPSAILNRVADEGPLAIVMAPTRELALQIDVEFHKLLSRQTAVQSCSVVGGQPIQQQAQRLREGVHVVVGTPGRINDCLEMAYLVLNQCCYIVLDEGTSVCF
jgi:ATP-dependent RNA helicase DDX23/PRP28